MGQTASTTKYTLALSVVTLGYATYRVLSHVLYHRAEQKLTVLHELEAAGRARERKLKRTAVICGGSIAGLFTARICADHFEEVIVIDPENDTLLAAAERLDACLNPDDNLNSHARVMQFDAFHIYQALLGLGLKQLFPGVKERAVSLGIPVGPPKAAENYNGIEVPVPLAEFYPEGQIPEIFGFARSTFEPFLRHEVRAHCPNVKFVSGTVTAVNVSEVDQSMLESVTYRETDGSNLSTISDAPFIIDCSGVARVGLTLLKRAGYDLSSPKLVKTYEPHMRYSSLHFKVDPEAMARICPTGFDQSTHVLKIIYPYTDRETKILGISHVGQNRIQILAGGAGYDHKITSVGELREHISSMNVMKPIPQWIFDLCDHFEGEPSLTAVYKDFKAGPSTWIKYHVLPQGALPVNFVALGDATMKLNPQAAQGATKALMCALILDSCLRKASTDISPSLAQSFFKLHAEKLGWVWGMNRNIDYATECCEVAQGESRERNAFTRWYIEKYNALMFSGDRDTALRRWQMLHWLAPPTNQYSLSIVFRILVNAALGRI